MKHYRIKYYLDVKDGGLIRTDYRMSKCDANVLRVIATFAQHYKIQQITFSVERYVTEVFVMLSENSPSTETNPW